MIGEVFGFLTVLGEDGRSKDKQKKYKCVCVCGTQTTVISGNLKKGNSTSCGCKRISSCSARMKTLNLRHGQAKTKLWKTWKGIIERTTKPYHQNYKNYGGAGIFVCEEWLVYENFANYIGIPPSDSHSIDRINNSKGYEPGNIRWATAKDQAHNRKTNVWVIVGEEKMLATDAAKKLTVSKSTIGRWIQSGKLKKHE
jgi:hypothetical protein